MLRSSRRPPARGRWRAFSRTCGKPGRAGRVGRRGAAIALYAVLVTDSFAEAVMLAVNHGGDSDSTAAIAGNVAGIIFGGGIPAEWLKRWSCAARSHKLPKIFTEPPGDIPNGTPNVSGVATPAG